MTENDFDAEYLRTWTEPDPQRRRGIIETMWASDGRMFVSSLGIVLDGVDAIAEHIFRVHEESIVGRGLTFRYDQRAQAGDALLLRWSMLSPEGESVGRGVDILHRDGDGKVTSVYMFMGID